MGKSLKVYILTALLLANLTAEHVLLHPISNVLFLGVLGVGLPLCVFSGVFKKHNLRSFAPLFLILLIYTAYQFTVGQDTINKDNLLYLIAKITTFLIMITSISTDFDLYFRKMIKPLGYIILILVVYGLLNNRVLENGRATLQFYNPNAASTISAMGFAAWLFRSEKIKTWYFIPLVICLIGVLSGGSRLALAMCILFVVMRYGVSKNLFVGLAVLFVLIMYVLPELGVHLPGFERLYGTFTGEVDIDREKEREAAEWMIAQRPYTGWGFNVENVGQAAELTEYGSHNGYLDTIKFMGYPFAIAWMACLIIPAYKIMLLYKNSSRYMKFHIAIIMIVLFGALYEGYLTGVNQVTTNLFFTSFAIMLYYRYNYYLKKKSYGK